MTYKRQKLSDVCFLVKGTYPTLKTEPGQYPLVVTAAYRRSASTYEFEGPAVCVPLISSTGHGDAALHRVHYQEGKFALANLLVALLPKDPSHCLGKYLYHLLMAKKDEYFVPLMQGTANVSLKEHDIAGVEIPLPPLDEQRRIVARIEALAAKIEEVRHLRQQVSSECDALCRSILFGGSGCAPPPTAMGEFVRLRTLDVTVCPDEIYDFAGVYCFGRGVFRGHRKTGMEFAYKRLTRLRSGDFVYPKLMAWEGALGVVPPECEGLVVSSEFPVFEIDHERALPETLDVYFRTPSVWPILAGTSTGTNVRRRRLNPADFLKYKMPLPPMSIQIRLREIRQRVDELKGLQAATAPEFDALLPSILDKAFKGEL